MSRKIRNQLSGMLFILPAFILFVVFVLYPVTNIFKYSLMKWDGMGEMTFIGLQNFVKIFDSPEFWTSLKNNFKFLLIGVPVWTLFPMIVAVLINEEVKGWKFFKSAYFSPLAIEISFFNLSIFIKYLHSIYNQSSFNIIFNKFSGVAGSSNTLFPVAL